VDGGMMEEETNGRFKFHPRLQRSEIFQPYNEESKRNVLHFSLRVLLHLNDVSPHGDVVEIQHYCFFHLCVF